MTRHKKAEPNTVDCVTRKVGAVIPGTNREMYYCCVDNADCKFSRPLGWDFVCKHPDNHAFDSSESPDSELISTNIMLGSAAEDLCAMEKQ